MSSENARFYLSIYVYIKIVFDIGHDALSRVNIFARYSSSRLNRVARRTAVFG